MAKVTNIKDAKAKGEVVDEPPALIYCMTCKHWAPTLHRSFGHCLLGAKSLSGPLVTTDLTTCGSAVAK